ncbi:MAG TPA: 3-hydroxyacyl-ACP dehydratase [Chitinophagaceae bacterium]|nr:3-hydroxyacyl-ACP dehydratase [Chitinophagaceae bacterium]
MLKDTLFNIILSDHQEGIINATLELNKRNKIFKGHFPGEPVLPGACMLQMVKEVLETTLNIPLRLKKADQIKFLGLIDPGINNILKLDITYRSADDNNVSVTASFTAQKEICFKFRGTFIAQ